MEELHEILYDLSRFRNNIQKMSSTLASDLAAITSTRIKEKYMILPKTERNVNIASMIKELYPNIEMLEMEKIENEWRTLNCHLETFCLDKRLKLETLKKRAFNNTIIIKKCQELKDFIETQKIGHLMTGGKKYFISEIKFFKASKPYLYYYGSGGLVHLMSKRYKKITNKYKILRCDINYPEYTAKVELRFSMNLNIDDIKDAVISVKNFKKFRNMYTDKAKEIIQKDVPLNFDKIKCKYFNAYVPTQYRKDLDISMNVLKYISVEFSNSEKYKNKVFLDAVIDKIPFNEFIDFVKYLVLSQLPTT